jgi:hypothetical protein
MTSRKDSLPVHQEMPSIEIGSMNRLRVFMEHHVFAVWDFMSLLKYLQNELAPARVPWTPPKNPAAARLINEIVLHEESDEAPSDNWQTNRHESHFTTYLRAMEEVGANTLPIKHFLQLGESHGFREALNWARMPEPARRFTRATFRLISGNQPHCVAAAFAFGRENLLPAHFKDILKNLGLQHRGPSIFQHYLNRHIELDGDDHGPAAHQLVSALCGNDSQRIVEADEAARQSVLARHQFLREINTALDAAASKPIGRVDSWKILHQDHLADRSVGSH